MAGALLDPMRQHLAVAVDHEAQQGRAFLAPQLRLTRIFLVPLEPGPQHIEIVGADAGLAAASTAGVRADGCLLAHAGLSRRTRIGQRFGGSRLGRLGHRRARIIGRRRLGW